MTWATKEDLISRAGDEFVFKLALRRNFDCETESFVASENKKSVDKVIQLALDDAKSLILHKLSCKFANHLTVNDLNFPTIKIWHMKMTVDVLKANGDCTACDCAKLDEFISCDTICSDNGVCLIGNKSFIDVSTPSFPCEACKGKCECC